MIGPIDYLNKSIELLEGIVASSDTETKVSQAYRSLPSELDCIHVKTI